jgi:Kelch motif protein/galactose oxidase-like protein
MRIALGLSLLALVATPSAVAPTGSMSSPRAAHSATLLRSGEVLIAGGCAVDGCELDAHGAETELFDPQTGRFRRGPDLLRRRDGHAAVRLPDGRVLIAGGWTGGSSPTATTELYDPARNEVTAGPSMTAPRGGFTITPLGHGRFLFAGGSGPKNKTIASAEIFDSAAQRFSRSGSMHSPRSAHAATRVAGGGVLVTGGSDAKDIVLPTTEIYNPRTGRFSRGPRMTIERYKHAAVQLRDGSVLVVGGSDARDFYGRYANAERYDPRRRRFRRTGVMAEHRFKLPDAVVRLPSGRVVVAGGGISVEAYDPRSKRFRKIGRVSTSLAFSTATLLANGKVLVAGGYDDHINVSRSAWLITP